MWVICTLWPFLEWLVPVCLTDSVYHTGAGAAAAVGMDHFTANRMSDMTQPLTTGQRLVINFSCLMPSSLLYLSLTRSTRSYVNVKRNLFKSPSQSVVLSSFEQYNVGSHSYQQFPWCANINGVGLWTDSGVKEANGRWKFIGGPNISQFENVLVAVHSV